MSQTKAQLVSGTTAQDLTVDNINTTSVNSGQLSNRNKIINGEAQVSQRGTISDHGTSVKYTAVDRFATRIGSSFNFDVTSSQSTDAPAGFYKSLKLTPDSTQTPSGSQNGGFQTKIEGQDIQDFGFGSSSAKPITISFYAKSGSSGAGTYSLDIRAVPAAGGSDYIQTRAFTVTSSWQRFTFTLEANGLSTSSSLVNNNTRGFTIIWHLASGPDDQEAAKTTWVADGSMKTVSGMSNFMSSTANEFYITGMQLEAGSTATDFEHRSFGQELALCQRYFQILSSNTTGGLNAHSRYPALGNGTNSAIWYCYHKQTMRAKPSLVLNNITSTTVEVFNYSTSGGCTFQSASMAEGDENHSQINIATTGGLTTASIACWRFSNNGDCHWAVNSEI